MLFKKLKKQSVLRMTALFLAVVFAIVIGACPGEDVSGTEGTQSSSSNTGPKTPVVADYNISNNLNQTVGDVTAVIVTKKDNNRSPGAITVWYTGTSGTDYDKSQALPQEEGSYSVTFDVEAATGWNAITGLSAGILVIGDPTPAATDFDVEYLNQLSNNIKAVVITPKAGKSNGTITIYYAGAQALPSSEGTYAVTFDVAAAAGWKAAIGLSAGNLLIGNAGNQSPKAADYNISNNLSQTAGSVTAVTVIKKDNTKSPGDVTVHYEGTDGTTYARSNVIPQTAGKYEVTFDVAAAAGWNGGSMLEAGILIIKGNPVLGDFDVSNNLSQNAGSVTAVTVTPKSGKSQGHIDVKYNNLTAVPQAAGSYPVTFDVAATDIWNAANISVGTLIVSKLTPVAGDFDISNLSQTAGIVTAVNITPKAGKSQGGITVKYNNAIAIPQTAGTYPVTFDVAETDTWNAAPGLSAGTLTVAAVSNQINYVSGPNALSWGTSTTNAPVTLGLQPGNTTTETRLNWYTAAGTRNPKIRFVKGTFTAATQLIEVNATAASAGGSNYHCKATVTGLQPGESYQYAVSSDGTNWSAAYNFKVPAAGPFKFAVIADPQLTTGNVDSDSRYPTTNVTTAAGWKETMDILATKGVSFIASGGDQVDTAANETQYANFFAPDGIKTLPFAPVMGNHDTAAQFFYHYNIPNETGTASSTSAGANYYYLYNNILFVVLNTGGASPASKNGAATQITAFRKAIQDAKTAHPNYDWLIVQHHKSTASVADHCADTDIQYYVEAGFETLMSELGVDFVLAGHDHVYARSYPLAGKADGKVSVPDKTKGGNTISNPGNPIYLTFTTGSGLKYYAVSADPYFKYANSLYVKTNTSYPYLGDVTNQAGDASTYKGSTSYMTGNYKPVSNSVFVQPYIPSYTVVEVNGKTIKFSTYPIATKSGQNMGAAQPYSFDKDVPYDWVQVTK